jgi:hypothetical protein
MCRQVGVVSSLNCAGKIQISDSNREMSLPVVGAIANISIDAARQTILHRKFDWNAVRQNQSRQFSRQHLNNFMQTVIPTTGSPGMKESRACRLVGLLQITFLVIALFDLNGPLVSYHYERQNQTFDMACHVFNEGWSAVLTPKTSFSLPGFETRPFTVARQEFPFHGVLGWPLAKMFGHPAAVVRVISIVFALWSIRLFFLILRQWLAPGMALFGTALWSLSPLLLHFGQVPMPDILCTTGMLASFWFALRNNLPASSASFLFAILAKISVIIFGLPVLTALLVARNCKTILECLRVSFCWGAIPLVGLAGWSSLEFIDPNTPWTVAKMINGRDGIHQLFNLKFYGTILVVLIPYGLGPVGILGCAMTAAKRCAPQIKPVVKWALLVSNILYVIIVFVRIPEPQYLLPSLAWLIMAAVFGINHLAGKTNHGIRWRAGVVSLICLQALSAFIFTSDLKASRVPDFQSIEKAAASIPPGARVIVAYPFYGAAPAVWLKHNVLAVDNFDTLKMELPRLQKIGFSYLVLLDVETRTKNASKDNALKMLASICHLNRQNTAGRDPWLSDYTLRTSPFCQYCDPQFARIFSGDFVIVYALPSSGVQNR